VKIKVSDLPHIRALCGELELTEEAIGKHAFKIGFGYQSIDVKQEGQYYHGQPALHEAVRKGLMEYRKAIIAQLKSFGADVDETKPEGDHGENEKA
jgi:hypothetical protein